MLLDYAILTAPAPLQAGVPADLTLSISNGGRQTVTVTSQTVTVTSIVITLPIGTNAKDLTASTGFASSTSSGWEINQYDGQLTLTPPSGGGEVGSTSIVVTIDNVAVNDQPGTTHLFIDETAALGDGSPATRSASLPVAKFPMQFSLTDLTVSPIEVPFGGSATLMWTGSTADQASYTLDYPGAPEHPIPVTNVGPYTANNLTIFPAFFTLAVTITLPGQDAPVTAQKQATVSKTPELEIISFGGSRPAVRPEEQFDLDWEVQLATSLTLEMPGIAVSTIDVTGLSGCTVANSQSVLVVTDPSGNQRGTFTLPSPFPLKFPFQLTASDAVSFVQALATVDVQPPNFVAFTGSSSVLSASEPGLLLQWQVELATSLSLQVDPIPWSVDVTGLSGCIVSAPGSSPPLFLLDPSDPFKQIATLTPPTPFPQSLTCVLTAGCGACFVQRQVSVQVNPPTINSFFLQNEGNTCYLHWSTANADPVWIANLGGVPFAAVPASGQAEADAHTTYTIHALGFGATATQTTT
jgi:hypothetical protein